MRRHAAALLVASMVLAAGRALAEGGPIVVEDGNARAEITSEAAALVVRLAVGERRAEWRYEDLSLDPEATDLPPAEYVQGGGGRLLLVRAYSGGAHCCWSLLAFDTGRLVALGPVLEGQSPIERAAGRKTCRLAAVTEPVERKKGQPTPRTLFCFDGERFRAKGPAPKR
jgi:hypothetical protein